MKQLIDASPAYVAYRKLKVIPKNAPLFDRTNYGGVIVHEGEVFCRLPGNGSRICGAKCAEDLDHFPHHMEVMHGAKDKGAMRSEGPRRKKRGLHADEVQRLKAFYENVLMKDEAYPGKPQSRKRKSREENGGEDGSSDFSHRSLKKYKVADIAELEQEETRVQAELSQIQQRLAVLRQRRATKRDIRVAVVAR